MLFSSCDSWRGEVRAGDNWRNDRVDGGEEAAVRSGESSRPPSQA